MLTELAQRLKPDVLPSLTPSEIMDEIAKVTPIYGGISHGRLEREGSLVLRTQLESPQPTQVLYASKQHKGCNGPARTTATRELWLCTTKDSLRGRRYC